MAESKIWEFNKGEWSEAYVFLKLLAEGRIYGADSKEEKNLSTYIDILNLLKFEKNMVTSGNTRTPWPPWSRLFAPTSRPINTRPV